MDFSLSEEQSMFRDLFHEFAENEVRPLAERLDREDRPPVETLRKAAEMELLGLPFPPEYGGAGLDTLSYLLLAEELARACLSTATIVHAHTAAASMAIYLHGTEEQKQRFLPAMARGEHLGAFAMSELGAGSDPAAITTTARRDGDAYVLNGAKAWILNGDIASTFVVLATTDPSAGPRAFQAFVVEAGTPGFAVGPRDRKMGLRGASMNPLTFDGCRVPVDNLLGGEAGSGWDIALSTLDFARISLSAACLGAAQGTFEMALEFAVTREQFGGPIAHKGAIQAYLADMAVEVEALRQLVYRAAWAVDSGQPYRRLASTCKLYGSEVACRVANKAVQVHGGSGYVTDYPMERVYRDVRATRIVEGASEIQRYLIAADILKERGLKVRP